jgi:hypothetical protein
MQARALLFLSIAVVASTLHAQTYRTPQTEYGYPDLQGNWTNPWLTPLQRPVHLGNQQGYSADEVAALREEALERDSLRQAPLDPNRKAPPVGEIQNQQADGNFEIMPLEVARVNGEYRTSLIVDPPNGRMPLIENAADIYRHWLNAGYGPFDGPEMRGPLERCLSPGGPLPLLIGSFGGPEGGNPAGDNPVRNVRIVQTKDHVMIMSEYFSLARVIPLGDAHRRGQGSRWMGDSIAHYEGDSLVIHTNQFRPEQSTGFLRHSAALEVSETYRRTGENEILFRYTVTDPQIYRQTFTAEIPLRRLPEDQKLYEYACHEGNYSMPSILRGARIAGQ